MFLIEFTEVCICVHICCFITEIDHLQVRIVQSIIILTLCMGPNC